MRSYLTQLLREGSRRGHEVVVVAPGPRTEESELEGGRLLRLKGPRMPYDPSYHALWNVGELRALIAREHPDVLQASSPYVAAWATATAPRTSIGGLRALVLHSDQIGSYLEPALVRWLGPARAARWLEPLWDRVRALAARFDRTIVAARWFAERLAAHHVPRVVQAPFGIDRARFSPALRDDEVRARLLATLGPAGADPRARVVAIVGRLAIEKRVAFLLEALADVARARPIAVAVLGDGPERARLEHHARRLGLAATFLGFIRDPGYARTLGSADLLVHGCAVETFGFSVAEALASGVGVVAPASGGAGELVTRDCGATYPADANAAAVARVIADALAEPGRFKPGALGRAAGLPDAGAHFDRLFAIYSESLTGRSGS